MFVKSYKLVEKKNNKYMYNYVNDNYESENIDKNNLYHQNMKYDTYLSV